MVSILIHIKLILLYVHSTMKMYKHMEIPCIVDVYSLSVELSKSPNTAIKARFPTLLRLRKSVGNTTL